MNSNTVYITYGKGDHFIKEKIPKLEELKIEHSCINKIEKAFWGSPVNANYGWKQWCEDNEFRIDRLEQSFRWTLKPEAKILYVKDLEDLQKVPFIKDNESVLSLYIDFESIIKNYDAMEICMDKYYFGHTFISEEELAFNTWDCDSIMVFNREMIVPINE